MTDTHQTDRSATDVEPLWRISDVALFLCVPVATLYQWRHLGCGPKAYRLGKHLRYRRTEVEAWLADQAA
jgi:predicted DNA-binding transcriptional regulator AlpA